MLPRMVINCSKGKDANVAWAKNKVKTGCETHVAIKSACDGGARACLN
jgi:hypothetical protein